MVTKQIGEAKTGLQKTLASLQDRVKKVEGNGQSFERFRAAVIAVTTPCPHGVGHVHSAHPTRAHARVFRCVCGWRGVRPLVR